VLTYEVEQISMTPTFWSCVPASIYWLINGQWSIRQKPCSRTSQISDLKSQRRTCFSKWSTKSGMQPENCQLY